MAYQNKTENVRCLALSVNIGAGHRMAAEALCETIARMRPGSQYKIIETLDYLEPGAGSWRKISISAY